MQTLNPLGKLVARARNSGRAAETSAQGAAIKGERLRARRDIRLPKPGDLLRRDYKGRAIIVRVLASGFEFDGRRFRSLSAIAKEVTGAHWNGLLFFGIVRQER